MQSNPQVGSFSINYGFNLADLWYTDLARMSVGFQSPAGSVLMLLSSAGNVSIIVTTYCETGRATGEK